MHGTPTLLFAFANDRANDSRYLRNLPEERRAIRTALRVAQESKHCDLIECPNTTVEELIAECQRRSSTLALFHFGGHADGHSLALETSSGRPSSTDAAILAEFLGGLRQLKLVVLNGCSTNEQVERLLTHGVPAVVGTTTAVRDEVATSFARHFYTSLGGGDTIEDAFTQASGAVRLTLGIESNARDGDTAKRAIFRDIESPCETGTSTGAPWHLSGGTDAIRSRVLSSAIQPLNFGAPTSPQPPQSTTHATPIWDTPTSTLRAGLTLGFHVGRLEFVMDSIYPEANAASRESQRIALTILQADGWQPTYASYRELVTSIITHYSISDRQKLATTMIGICAFRLSLVSVKAGTPAATELEQLAYSALAEVDEEILSNSAKQRFFQQLKSTKPTIAELCDFVRRSKPAEPRRWWQLWKPTGEGER